VREGCVAGTDGVQLHDNGAVSKFKENGVWVCEISCQSIKVPRSVIEESRDRKQAIGKILEII